ncbi:MAG: TetR/AcrR family transcriptional regulator [Spirochaetes bacterium]|nr:TetR/AcrR family transcriptional regulator [Spirochaetota bacterium]MBU0957149.1 TetR/AcrR family transcriptional regulator [Spirochaetota bacterium]
MPQRKDDSRREAILLEAKRLFATQGYEATSIASIVAGLNMPVGSVYTYFKDKQSLLVTILEEGWEEFRLQLEAALQMAPDATSALNLILERFLPALFADADFITLALNETGRSFALNDKLGWLSAHIGLIIRKLAEERNIQMDFDSRLANTALSVFFLGSLDTIRLAKRENLDLNTADVLKFIRLTIRNVFGDIC